MPATTLHILARTNDGRLVCTVPAVRAWFHLTPDELTAACRFFGSSLQVCQEASVVPPSEIPPLDGSPSRGDAASFFRRWSTEVETLDETAIFRSPVAAITSRCNLRCSYCYMGIPSIEGVTRCDLAEGVVTGFIRSVVENSQGAARSIQFFGGEPLLHPGLPRLIEFALAQGLYVGISTNGAGPRLRRDDLAAYVTNPRVEWRISLDSHIPELHEQYRGKGTFRSIVRNLDHLAEQGANVSLKTVLHEGNIADFEGFLEFAQRYNFPVAYGLLTQLGEAQANDIRRNLTSPDVVRTILGIYARKPELIRLLGPSPFGRMIRVLYVKQASNVPRFFFYLHHDGFVYPMDELVDADLRVGRAHQLDVRRLQELQQELAIDREDCRDCSIEPFCFRGSYGALRQRDPDMQGEFDSCSDKREAYALLMSLGKTGSDIARMMFDGDRADFPQNDATCSSVIA